jgi:hypothetical protein
MSNELSQSSSNNNNQLLYKLCEHIKDNGVRCGAPALSGDIYCRFHVRVRTTVSPADQMYELPILETEQSVQIALQHMMRGLLSGNLSEKKAKVMMTGINTAAKLLRQQNQNAPREALLEEIATEIRGRVASKRKPVQSADSDLNESAQAATA